MNKLNEPLNKNSHLVDDPLELNSGALEVYDNALKKWQVVQYAESEWCVFRVPDEWDEDTFDGTVQHVMVWKFANIEDSHQHVRQQVINEVGRYYTEALMSRYRFELREKADHDYIGAVTGRFTSTGATSEDDDESD